MLFNSLEFAIFFPIVATIYFVLPQRLRTPHLLVSSCVFYMAFIPAYILILGLTIVIDYTAGIYLEKVAGRARSWLLAASVIATCLVLFVFKYFFFFTNNAIGLAGLFGWQLSGPSIEIILPIGLSFHTFQSLSYVIEVYRGKQKAEYNLPTYATYVMFFPQLVAGPIERPQHLLHQFYERHEFDYERIARGLRRIAWGFFKKLVIADRLALYVNDVYGTRRTSMVFNCRWDHLFRLSDLLRLLRLLGHCDRLGARARLQFHGKLRQAIPFAVRCLEFWQALAHFAFDLVSRLRLHSDGRQPVRRAAPLCKSYRTFTISGLWHGANWTYVCLGTAERDLFAGRHRHQKVRVIAHLRLIGLHEGTCPRGLVMWRLRLCCVCGMGFLPGPRLGRRVVHFDAFRDRLELQRHRHRAVSASPDAGRHRGDCIAGSRTVAAEPDLALGDPGTAASRAAMGGVCQRGHRHDHVWCISSDTVHLFSVLMS